MPSLRRDHERLLASRQAAYTQPWSAAVVAALDTKCFRGAGAASADRIAATLGLPVATIEESLGVLVRAGVLLRRRSGYELLAPLVTDTRAEPEQARALRRHWAGVSASRLAEPRADDLFSYSVFALSKADYAALRKLQVDYFQRVRALVTASEPSERVALVALHLLHWDP